MKICAVTMVYQDYWALSQWYAHYGRHLGEGNLFIVSHGSDPKVQALCPKASVITVPRDDLTRFDVVRSDMLNSLQNMLGLTYDWVIRTDADELICFDPNMYSSFADMMSQSDAPALFALGFDLFEYEGDDVLTGIEPVLSKRSTAVFSGHYSKAWAVREAIDLRRHGVRTAPKKVIEFVMPSGCFLAHLKYANMPELFATDEIRMKIAGGEEKGLPGNAWQFASIRAIQQYRMVAGLAHLDWEAGRNVAYQALQDPIRNQDRGLVRCKSIKFDFKTILPDWFKDC